MEQQICDQFAVGILDGDILHFLESTVPPADLKQVTFVRTVTVTC